MPFSSEFDSFRVRHKKTPLMQGRSVLRGTTLLGASPRPLCRPLSGTSRPFSRNNPGAGTVRACALSAAARSLCRTSGQCSPFRRYYTEEAGFWQAKDLSVDFSRSQSFLYLFCIFIRRKRIFRFICGRVINAYYYADPSDGSVIAKGVLILQWKLPTEKRKRFS